MRTPDSEVKLAGDSGRKLAGCSGGMWAMQHGATPKMATFTRIRKMPKGAVETQPALLRDPI